jgi:hypothetical protein
MQMNNTVPRIRCRQIAEADIPAVAALLTRGFPNRSHRFWLHALHELERREPPPGLPKYGYCLDSGGTLVGALLAIAATVHDGERVSTRCNLSSWYVEPAFRFYAPLLSAHAAGRKDVTYLNVSPAPHTRPIIEAQGFSRYCDGVFVAVPFLQGWSGARAVKVFDAAMAPAAAFEPFEQEILQGHAQLGCLSLWCETAERAYPLVFRPRLVKGFVPCAQLIYCRDVADLLRFAGPIGRYLAWRGRPFVIIDSNAPIPGLIGTFRRGSMPKYFKGPLRPRLGDLAYTEYAVLGV